MIKKWVVSTTKVISEMQSAFSTFHFGGPRYAQRMNYLQMLAALMPLILMQSLYVTF